MEAHHKKEIVLHKWWALRGSNPGPFGYEPNALPVELKARKIKFNSLTLFFNIFLSTIMLVYKLFLIIKNYHH